MANLVGAVVLANNRDNRLLYDGSISLPGKLTQEAVCFALTYDPRRSNYKDFQPGEGQTLAYNKKNISSTELYDFDRATEFSTIRMIQCSFKDDAICGLRDFRNVTELDLTASRGHSLSNFTWLSTLIKLKKLVVSECAVFKVDELTLSCLVSLQKLDCSAIPFLTDDDIQPFRSLSSLTQLNLSRCPLISNDGLVSTAQIKTLQNLNVSQCKDINEKGVQAFAKELVQRKVALKVLDLSGCKGVKPEAVVSLAPIDSLEKLMLMQFPSNKAWQKSILELHAARNAEDDNLECVTEDDLADSMQRLFLKPQESREERKASVTKITRIAPYPSSQAQTPQRSSPITVIEQQQKASTSCAIL